MITEYSATYKLSHKHHKQIQLNSWIYDEFFITFIIVVNVIL